MGTPPSPPGFFGTPRWPRFTRTLLLALALAAGAHAARDFADTYKDLRPGPQITATAGEMRGTRVEPELPEGIEKLADGLAERTEMLEQQARRGETHIALCDPSNAQQGGLAWLVSTNPTFPGVARLPGPPPAVNSQFPCLGARWKVAVTIPGAVVAKQVN
jgi:hypothetical protein